MDAKRIDDIEDDWDIYKRLAATLATEDESKTPTTESDGTDTAGTSVVTNGVEGRTGNDGYKVPVKEITLPVIDIHYGRRSIPCCFRHGDSNSCIRLEDTMRKLIRNKKCLKKMPRLYVMEHEGRYWAVGGNRRLYVYRCLADIGLLASLNVLQVPYVREWFTKCVDSNNDGDSVEVRGCVSGDCDKLLCSRIYREETTARRRHWCRCVWILAILMILVGVCVTVLPCMDITRYKAEILNKICPGCLRLAPECSCPGLEICERLPVLDYIKLKWRAMVGDGDGPPGHQ